MSFFEKHKLKIIFAAIVIVSLAGAFLLEGNMPNPQTAETMAAETVKPRREKKQKKTPAPEVRETDKAPQETPDILQEENEADIEYSLEQGMELDESGHDKYQTEPVPEGMPVPVEPQTAEVTDKKLTCTLSIRCDAILDNMSRLKKGVESVIPSDGIILPPQTVEFYEGENVFNVLLRETKRNEIHMEYKNTPAFNTVYIKGINNICEFDCGESSGWQYKVNGYIPSYGCSRYLLHDGDVIEWLFVCDMGEDIK